jgi:glyoxylase-like metal-dependent hydrolase (beta-lactamase superfamily II)
MTTTHGKYLNQLERFFFVNIYLVEEADGFTLVDTAIGGSANAILKAAEALRKPIVRIALTHAHADHVGSVDALHKLLPNVEISISARDSRFLTGDKRLDPGEPQTPLKGSYPVIATKPNRLLNPGDRVGSLQVIAAPGHTPGHIAFLDTRDGSLIAGDAYASKGGIATAGTLRLLFPIGPFVFWNQPTALETAKQLRALKPTRLAVGHGRVIENPDAAMAEAIEVAERRLSKAQDGSKVQNG